MIRSGHDLDLHPVTPDLFEDFADVVNPNRRAENCWCLAHRLRLQDLASLAGDRERAMRRLCERENPPGVVANLDGRPVGWCDIGPRAEIPRLVHSRLAFVGTRVMFDRAGFEVAGRTDAIARKMPRIVMRRVLG